MGRGLKPPLPHHTSLFASRRAPRGRPGGTQSEVCPAKPRRSEVEQNAQTSTTTSEYKAASPAGQEACGEPFSRQTIRQDTSQYLSRSCLLRTVFEWEENGNGKTLEPRNGIRPHGTCDGTAMAEILRFTGSHFYSPKGREYLFERHHMLPCHVLRSHRIVHRPLTHPCTPERGKVRTETHCSTEIVCERPDVRPGSAGNTEQELRVRIGENVARIDLHFARGKVHFPALSHFAVCPLASHLHRTVHRRYLCDLADEPLRDQPLQIRDIRLGPAGLGDDLFYYSFTIIRRAHRPETDTGIVLLVEIIEEFDGFQGFGADREYQKT